MGISQLIFQVIFNAPVYAPRVILVDPRRLNPLFVRCRFALYFVYIKEQAPRDIKIAKVLGWICVTFSIVSTVIPIVFGSICPVFTSLLIGNVLM